jgi:hypothetical protein
MQRKGKGQNASMVAIDNERSCRESREHEHG